MDQHILLNNNKNLCIQVLELIIPFQLMCIQTHNLYLN